MRRILAIAAALLIALEFPAAPAQAHAPGAVTGFEYPESVYWDGETGSFYVSNFGGSTLDPKGRDADGYVSQLSGEGQLVAARWVAGLRSHKGMRRLGPYLFVADTGRVVVIDVAAATIAYVVDLDGLGAQLPNDVTVDEATGDVFVSDTLANAVYRIPKDSRTAETWLSSPDLESPNGLLVDGRKLLVAGYGREDIDPSTGKPQTGRVVVVDLATKAIAPLGRMAPVGPLDGMDPVGQLDGIEKRGDGYLVTDNPGGRLLRVGADGSVAELAKDLTTPADIGFRPGDGTLAVPQLSANDVRFFNLDPGGGRRVPPPD